MSHWGYKTRMKDAFAWLEVAGHHWQQAVNAARAAEAEGPGAAESIRDAIRYLDHLSISSGTARHALRNVLEPSMADRQSRFEAEQLEQTAPEHRAALEELYKRRNPLANEWQIIGSYKGRTREVIDSSPTKAEAKRIAAEYRRAYGAGWKITIEAPEVPFGSNGKRRSSRPKRNPARLVMPERLVLLGELRELVVSREGGAEQIFRFDDGGTGLFSDASGRELYGISLGDQPVSVVSGVPSSMKKAGDLFGKWSARKARKAMKFNLPDNAAQLERIGHAVSLVYRSDKWGQKPTMYEHVFTGSAEVHTDRVREPRVFGIHGPGRKRLVTARGIVG